MYKVLSRNIWYMASQLHTRQHTFASHQCKTEAYKESFSRNCGWARQLRLESLTQSHRDCQQSRKQGCVRVMLVLMQIAIVLLCHAWHPASICMSSLQSQQRLPHLKLFAGVVLNLHQCFHVLMCQKCSKACAESAHLTAVLCLANNQICW